MKKLLKLVVKIIVIVILFIAVGLVVLRVMFPPQKLKQMAIDYAANNFHREISFDKLSFNLIGFTLENFAMSENSTFEQGTFIKANRVEAKAALKPLLKKRIEIAAIYLDGVNVNIQKNEDGAFNFDSLVTPAEGEQPTTESTAETPAPETTSDEFVFTAQHIKATDCDFSYTDKQSGLITGIEDLNFQLDNVDFTKPFPVQISFVSHTKDNTGLTLSIPVNIAFDLFLAGLDMNQAYADVTQANASYKNLKLDLQGKITNFHAPDVNLTGTITGLTNTVLTDLLPDLPNFSLPAIQLVLQAATDLDKSTAQITKASLKILDSEFATHGQIGWGGTNTTYQLSGNLKADIAQIVKMTDDTGFDPKGNLNATFTATDKNNGSDVKGTLTLKNVSALYPPFTLTETNGTIKLASLDDISCPSLTGLLNGEKFDSSFSYKSHKDITDLDLKLNLAKLTLTQFPSSSEEQTAAPETTAKGHETPAPETYLNLTTDIKVGPVSIPYFRTDGVTAQAALTNLSDSMQKANGTVSFSLEPGAITEMDTLIKESKVARIILLPLNILNSVGKKLNLNLFEAEVQAKKGEIAITKAEGKYTFTNGVMTLDTTKFESTLTDLNATGTVNFVSRDLNMKASATLVTKQTPVVIKIGGTIDNPSGKLDVVNTVTSVVGGILSYKAAKSAVQGTTHAASNVASTTAQDTVKAASSAVKALGGLFKKKSDKTADETEQK